MVASSSLAVSLAACSGDTLQRMLCRNRPSLPTARKVCVSPINMVTLEGTTESAGESCARTQPVMLMLNATRARTAAYVTFRIGVCPRTIILSLGYVWRGNCESYLGDW